MPLPRKTERFSRFFKLSERNIPFSEQEPVIRETTDTKNNIRKMPLYSVYPEFPAPALKNCTSLHKKRQSRPEIRVNCFSQLNALPKVKTEHFQHRRLLDGMNVPYRKLLAASHGVCGEKGAVCASDHEKMDRGTEENKKGKEKKAAQEDFSVQHSLPLREKHEGRPPLRKASRKWFSAYFISPASLKNLAAPGCTGMEIPSRALLRRMLLPLW